MHRFSRLAALLGAGALALAIAVPASAAEPAELIPVVTANDNGTPAAGQAWVRVLHGSPDAPEVDVYVGADLASATKVDPLSGLSFGQISDYFEVAPGGWTSLERHQHPHAVVVLVGCGEVRLGSQRHALEPFDVAYVAPGDPHQFRAAPDEKLGLLCIVDRERDRPELLDEESIVP